MNSRIFYENRKVDFYCRDSQHTSRPLGIAAHLHYHIELAYILDGQTRITVDTESFVVKKGDIFIVFPNQVHRFETIDREKYILFIVNPDIIPEFSKLLISKLPTSNVINNIPDDSEIVSLMYRIAELQYSDETYKDILLHGYLLTFFSKLFQKMEFRDTESRDIHVLGMILNYCTNNFSRDLSLSVLEKELHISKYYISHIISNKLKIGFNDYINSLRISNACKYLTKTDKSITEISETVGFNTLRTFNRAFQKQMGITPSAYRAGNYPHDNGCTYTVHRKDEEK